MTPYLRHLRKDPKLAAILHTQEPIVLKRKQKIYLHLCASIMSQQLSTKVAAVIHQRFLRLYADKHPTPRQILDTPVETLRSIGLSAAKAAYVHHVCRFFLEEKLTDRKLYTLSSDEVVWLLTRIKGVGRWTAEMILMFALAHEDVFPANDLGIQHAMIRLYGLDAANKKALLTQMHQIAAAWAPYRTYASMHLWRWKDGE